MFRFPSQRRSRSLRKSHRPNKNLNSRLRVESLDERIVPTVSALVQSFNDKTIAAGRTIWFNAEFKVSGLGSAPDAMLWVRHQSISFTASGVPYTIAVPDSTITFTAGLTQSTADYDVGNGWFVNLPTSWSGNGFLCGAEFTPTVNLPKSIKNVTWTADFTCDQPGMKVSSWQWGAAVYTQFNPDDLMTQLNVKPKDGSGTLYNNNDHAGVPEAYKSFVVAGGTGGGGTNWTGNLCGGKSVTPGVQNSGATLYPFPSSNPVTDNFCRCTCNVEWVFVDLHRLQFASLHQARGDRALREVVDVARDEHAMALGVRQVNVKTSSGTVTTNYPIATMTTNPSVANNPALGTTALTGDQAGIDASGRPISPMLYITDITNDPHSLAGDWQYGGHGYGPSTVFGSWKAFTRLVDYTQAGAPATITADVDPAKNNWNLGAGSDAPPAGTANEGYGAEVRWNLADLQAAGVLLPGHTYRFYVMDHDGDQNKIGGDAGQAAFNYFYPGPPAPSGTASISGTVFQDVNFDGIQNNGEVGIEAVEIDLTGIDSTGHSVSLVAYTDANGHYSFTGLAAGSYQLFEVQPFGYLDGGDSVGTVGGQQRGTQQGQDLIGQINLLDGDQGINYNFAEIFDNHN